MSLDPGARLGSYEIVAKLGEGGMGEVYRARDTRLGRDVAIKILPSHLAADAAARARFEREARAIAALSHPNILAVYDVGTADRTDFVVMELLDGETLRQRLAGADGAALPIRKAIQIGIEVAHALAAAHDRQIVHRDIKPENVFLASDGRVKLLDFGLARQTPPDRESSDAATHVQPTDPGTVMGTVGYMAPEQVKGQPVDHRADIFALGCVLFEMASGRRPFHRETAAETMSAILRDEPADLVRGNALPDAFEPIVRHCLEKRPEERFQSAHDLAFALQALGTGAHAAARPALTASAAQDRPNEPATRRPISLPALAIAAGIAVAAFAAGRAIGGQATPVRVAGLRIDRFQQVTDVAGVETSPTLSPDGKTIVYVSAMDGSLQIFSQRVGSRSAAALTSGSANVTPAFSPDGERIAFRSDRDGGGIFQMTSSGESITRISDEGFSPSWSPDGSEIVAARGTFVSPTDVTSTARGLLVVDVKSGRKRDVLSTGQALQPSWSPHGQRIAYFTLRPNSGQRDLFTVAADGSEASAPVEVTNDAPMDWSATWSPAGDFLYFSSNRGGTMNLWRVAIDEVSGRVLGEPEAVTVPSSWSGFISFSRDGLTMAFASLDWRSTLQRQSFDPVREVTIGPPTPLLRGSRPIRDHSVSPDGEWIAFNETAAREDLFVARVDGREYRRLTDDPARDRGPAWAPDGQRIFFYSDRGGQYDLWSIRPDGSHLVQLTRGANANFPVLSPDGKRLAFAGVSASGLMTMPVIDGLTESPQLSPPMPDGLRFWAFGWSPDGARVLGFAAGSDGTLRSMAVYDVTTQRYQLVAGREDGSFAWPAWLKDGRRFLNRTASGIAVVNADTGARKLLTSVRGYFIGKSLSVSADSTWYSYTETGTEGDIWIAVVRR